MNDEDRRKSSSGLSVWAELLYQTLHNTVTVHTEKHTLRD